MSVSMTQKDRVLQTLQENKNKWIPSYYWVDERPRILRAGARIHELREEGHDIETKHEGNIYYYRLLDSPNLFEI